jgi:hypothetical protein
MPKFEVYQKVLVRDTEDGIWAVDLFSHYIDGEFVTLGNRLWAYCIPYHGNEDLVGTSESAWKPKTGELVAMSDGLNKWVARIFVGMGETVGPSLYLGLDSESDNLDRAAYYSFCEPLKHHFNIDDKEEN